MATKPAPAVTDEAMVEAIAGLYAAANVFNRQAAGLDPAEDFFASLATKLKLQCFGDPPESDEGYNRDPITVAISARDDELTADVLGELASVEQERAEQYREHARRVRAAARLDVHYRGGIE